MKAERWQPCVGQYLVNGPKALPAAEAPLDLLNMDLRTTPEAIERPAAVPAQKTSSMRFSATSVSAKKKSLFMTKRLFPAGVTAVQTVKTSDYFFCNWACCVASM